MADLCASVGSNLGTPDCDIEIGALSNLVFTRGKEFTDDELNDPAALKAAVQAACLLGHSDPNKMWVLPLSHSTTDNTGEAAKESFDDGLEQVTTENNPKYTLLYSIGMCKAQALASFIGFQGKTYVVDNTGKWFFVRKPEGGGRGLTVGSFYSDAPRFRGYKGLRATTANISFGSIEEFKKNLGAVKIDFDVQQLVNIQNVNLKPVAATGNTFTISARMACTNVSLYSGYKTLLADADAWVVKRADTGAPVTVASVAFDDELAAWVITIGDGVATGTKLSVELATPAALKELNINGIEAASVIVTKAA